MNKKTALILIAMAAFAALIVAYNPGADWVEIPGTGGIHYDKASLKHDGSMVYATLKNENPQAKRAVNASEILFTAALYCDKGKIRTLTRTIRHEDGTVESDDANHLEADPGSDELNESHDLMDISDSPALSRVHDMLCTQP